MTSWTGARGGASVLAMFGDRETSWDLFILFIYLILFQKNKFSGQFV